MTTWPEAMGPRLWARGWLASTSAGNTRPTARVATCRLCRASGSGSVLHFIPLLGKRTLTTNAEYDSPRRHAGWQSARFTSSYLWATFGNTADRSTDTDASSKGPCPVPCPGWPRPGHTARHGPTQRRRGKLVDSLREPCHVGRTAALPLCRTPTRPHWPAHTGQAWLPGSVCCNCRCCRGGGGRHQVYHRPISGARYGLGRRRRVCELFAIRI